MTEPKKNYGITEMLFLFGACMCMSVFCILTTSVSLGWANPISLFLSVIFYRLYEQDRKERIAYKAYKKANGPT